MPRPPRVSKFTVLLYCEGKRDTQFAKYLKSLYCERGSREVRIRSGTGGGLKTHVSDVKGIAQTASFNKKYIFSDHDLVAETPQEAFTEANQNSIKLIWSHPCIEGMLLRIMDESFNQNSCNSTVCKRKFRDDHLGGSDDNLDDRKMKQLFPKDLLDRKLDDIEELGELIKAIRG